MNGLAIELALVSLMTLLIVPAVRIFAFRNGLVDAANGDPLKIHREPVAIAGGMVILLALFLGSIIARFARPSPGSAMDGCVLGAAFCFAIGLWDDTRGLSPRLRLFLEIIAALLLMTFGVKLNVIPFAWASIPLTLFYLVGAVNAFNVIDGMDGLCTGVSLISCIGFFVVGLYVNNDALVAVSLVLFAGLLGFLPYNFHPAKMFLGNSGSALTGFLMGSMAVMTASRPYDFGTFVASILIPGVPVFDMAFAIFRRAASKRPLFQGDRNHLYDVLLRKGLSQPAVWGIMCFLQALSVGIAVLLLINVQ